MTPITHKTNKEPMQLVTTLSTSQAADILLQDDFANWTRPGAFALCEYLEELSEDMEEPVKIHPVDIRCEYSEYGSAAEAVEQYTGGASGILNPLAWLQDRTTVIVFDGGVIIQDF